MTNDLKQRLVEGLNEHVRSALWLGSPKVSDSGALEVRTSDRVNFRSCRRRFFFSSHLHMNLESAEIATPLWMGTGFHFALEDFHGYKKYSKPSEAFRDYYKATKSLGRIPDDADEAAGLAMQMLDYYSDYWLLTRSPLDTYVVDGVPQVEVDFRIELPIEGPNGEKVYYKGTFDRIAMDEYGCLYVVEYKTAKQYSWGHLDLDAQVTAYYWAAEQWYGRPIDGVIYQQHIKKVPSPPRFLTTKGTYSTDRRQSTTYTLYRKALVDMYGKVEYAPEPNRKFLQFLMSQEDEYGDKFIRRDTISRSRHEVQMEGLRVLEEVKEMLQPGIFITHKASRECQVFCPFVHPCLMIELGDEWKDELAAGFKQRDRGEPEWRKLIGYDK